MPSSSAPFSSWTHNAREWIIFHFWPRYRPKVGDYPLSMEVLRFLRPRGLVLPSIVTRGKPSPVHLYLPKLHLTAGYNKPACGFPLRALPFAGACPGASGMRPLRRSVMCKTGSWACGARQRPAPWHAFSPRHVPAAQSACQMIGSNNENPITPTSRRSPGPVYLYERRGVYGA